MNALIDMTFNTFANVKPQGFHPSSSSLAGVLGCENGPQMDHISRVGRHDPYRGASVQAAHESEVGSSGHPHSPGGTGSCDVADPTDLRPNRRG